jgi:hypothetical protein
MRQGRWETISIVSTDTTVNINYECEQKLKKALCFDFVQKCENRSFITRGYKQRMI